MNERVMSPVPVQPSDGPYEFQAWPAWFYGPEGQSRVFNNPEEVPDGWVDYDEFAAGALEGVASSGEGAKTNPSGAEGARVLTADQRKSAIDKLVDGNTQKDLATMLELMNEAREEDAKIQFLANWPKQKLAETIVDNGGPLETE